MTTVENLMDEMRIGSCIQYKNFIICAEIQGGFSFGGEWSYKIYKILTEDITNCEKRNLEVEYCHEDEFYETEGEAIVAAASYIEAFFHLL